MTVVGPCNEDPILARFGGDFCHLSGYWCGVTGDADHGIFNFSRMGCIKRLVTNGCLAVKTPQIWYTIRAWRENGTVPRHTKWWASIMMLVSAIVMLFTPAPFWVKVFTNLTMLTVVIWLWLRPEPRSSLVGVKET